MSSIYKKGKKRDIGGGRKNGFAKKEKKREGGTST